MTDRELQDLRPLPLQPQRRDRRPAGALLVKPLDLNIDAMLKRLSLANTRRTSRDLVARAEKEQWSYPAFVCTACGHDQPWSAAARSTPSSASITAPSSMRAPSHKGSLVEAVICNAAFRATRVSQPRSGGRGGGGAS